MLGGTGNVGSHIVCALLQRGAVVRALLNWGRVARRIGGYTVQRVPVNAQAGALIVSAEGAIISAWTLDIVDNRIAAIRAVVNPDKLRHLAGAGNFGEWLSGGR